MIDEGTEHGPNNGGEMISCAEAVARVYEYLDGELESPDQERVREHVRLCKKCYPFFDFERAFLDFIREKGFADEASQDLLRRVKEIVREDI